MKRFALALCLCLTLSAALADEPVKQPSPTPWIVFPDVNQPPAPPSPLPPSPDTVSRLTADQIYVVDAKEPCFLIASPAGLVTVAQDAGPIKIRGRFVGGSGKPETKTFGGAAVFTVEAKTSGRVELLVVKVGAKGPADIVRRTVDVDSGVAPRPPPGPEPPIPPGPAPTPGFLPIAGKRVLIVWDDKQVLPPGQHSVIYGKAVRDYLKQKVGDEARIWPVGTDGYLDSKEFGDAMKRPKASLPWIVIGNGTAGVERPLPATVPETLALLKLYFGE